MTDATVNAPAAGANARALSASSAGAAFAGDSGAMALMSQAVTLLKRNAGADDGMGNSELVVVGTSTIRARIQQTVTVDVPVSGGITVKSDWMAYVPSALAIDHQDQIQDGGRLYEVVGDPYVVPIPSGTAPQQQVRLVAVT